MIYRKDKQFCSKGHDTHKLGGRDKYGACRECGRIRHREHYFANDTTYKAKDRDSKRLKRYGTTKSFYDELLKTQNNVCAICGGVSKKRSLSVDHDHTNGCIRGLLCSSCNSMLGYARDNVKILEVAIDYLTKER